MLAGQDAVRMEDCRGKTDYTAIRWAGRPLFGRGAFCEEEDMDSREKQSGMMMMPGESVWDEVNGFHLKKCPFCGGIADWRFEETPEEYIEWRILCENRYCFVKPSTTLSISPSDTADKWNRRGGGQLKKPS